MNDAIKKAIAELTADCPSCAGPDGQKIANALQNATFVYVPNLQSIVPGVGEVCANARPINSKIIHVGSAAFGPDCCRLDSTLVHEATHKVRGDNEAGPQRVEDQCFGCH